MDDSTGTMTVDLDDVLAGEGSRAGEGEEEGGIELVGLILVFTFAF